MTDTGRARPGTPVSRRAVARRTAIRSRLCRRAYVGIRAWRATIEPRFKITHRMGKTPFLQHRSSHRRCRTRGMLGLDFQNIGEQPGLELPWVGVAFDDTFKHFALERKADGIGRLIAFATPSAPFGAFERSEQGFADVGRAKLP